MAAVRREHGECAQRLPLRRSECATWEMPILPPTTFGFLFLLREPRLNLSALVAARLQVEGALVLQPPPVTGDAADLLTVVVWRGVREGGDGGVDAVALDAAEEG